VQAGQGTTFDGKEGQIITRDAQGNITGNTHVDAGNKLTIESGGDTNIKGAVATGKQVVAT
jgi:hypothetical protein